MDVSDLVAAGPARQVAALDAGEVSARELVDATLARIAERDPSWNAFVDVDPADARAAADAVDTRRAAGARGPLLGVPVAVKDDTDVAGWRTGLGTRASTRVPTRDDETVRRLRGAGAVVVGKTTLPELAVYGFTESEATGVTRNPHHRGHTSGGSSGGSAAAVAGGLVGLATASDGAGSIRIPAACCGLPGFKPTPGRVPTPPVWHGLSTQGCLTRHLADAATYLDTVGDFDTSLADALRDGTGPLRVGVDLRPFPASAPRPADRAVADAVRAAADRLSDLGHDVRDVRVRWGLAAQAFTVRYLGGIHESAAGVEHPVRLEPRTRQVAALGAPVTAAAVARAREQGRRLGERLLDDLGVDVLLTPTMGGPAPEVGRWEGRGGLSTTLSMGRFYAWTPGWNHTGQPAVSLPWGRTTDGLPLAVQLVAAPGDDARLMAVAGSIEADGAVPLD
ncbi:amidase family protein [Solicola sp. PLA-1-18]|uniref:amidase family protein n=1 Tax=Solicola sp. PLA-1-18 TaxID=3380532 RepID=UPI003B7BB57D